MIEAVGRCVVVFIAPHTIQTLLVLFFPPISTALGIRVPFLGRPAFLAAVQSGQNFNLMSGLQFSFKPDIETERRAPIGD